MDKKEFAEYVKQKYKKDPNGCLDRHGIEFIESDMFNIRVVEPEKELSWSESFIGTSLGSIVDYGKTYEKIKSDTDYSKKDLKKEVRQKISKKPRQINFYDKDSEEVYVGAVIKLKKDGYAVYPDEKNKISI